MSTQNRIQSGVREGGAVRHQWVYIQERDTAAARASRAMVMGSPAATIVLSVLWARCRVCS